MEIKFLRRQRTAGNGPERLELERSSETTEPVAGSQTTPFHLQGVASLGLQLARAELGSSKPSLACWRYRPSWFRQRMRGGDVRIDRRRNMGMWWWCSIFPAAVEKWECGGWLP